MASESSLIECVRRTWEAVRDYGFCPVCKGNPNDGHEGDCALCLAYEEVQRND